MAWAVTCWPWSRHRGHPPWVCWRWEEPDPEPILIDCSLVTKIRAPLPDEYADTVQSVITIGKVRQGVREDLAKAKMLIRAHGGML